MPDHLFNRYIRAISVAPSYEPVWRAFKELCQAQGKPVSKRILQLIEEDLRNAGRLISPNPKPARNYPLQSLADRFWAKVRKTESCWIWTGARTGRGYGALGVSHGVGKMSIASAHRVSYEIAYRPIPKQLIVLHTCDNPACVRPDHLVLGTHLDNWKDSRAKGRWKPAEASRPSPVR